MTEKASPRKADDPIFRYETEEGGVISLPRFKHIPVGLIRKVRKLPAVDQSFTILETIADAQTLELIDAMDSGEMNEMLSAWQADSQVTPGESRASSGS